MEEGELITAIEGGIRGIEKTFLLTSGDFDSLTKKAALPLHFLLLNFV